MKSIYKLFILVGLPITMTLPVTTYAVTPKALEISHKLDKNIFKIHDTEINVDKQLDLQKLMAKDLSISSTTKVPKILIIHSHPEEQYAIDTVTGEKGGVIDVGDALERILEEKYKVSVLHYKDKQQIENANGSIADAYERMEVIVSQILKKNPSIEAIIDLHRDGGVVPTAKLINDKPTAQIHIINGLSMDKSIGKIGSLKTYPNPYIEDNLSLSVQLKEKCDQIAPELVSGIILKEFRYSLHMMPKSLLIDIGNNKDKVEDVLNALDPFAKSLADVLNLKETDK